MIKLAIVDNDLRFVKGLRGELLEFSEIESVTCSDSGLKFQKDLEQMVPDKRPEVILMDISMSLPDEGIRTTRQIKIRFPDIGIIMFTISDEDERIFDAFKAGAMGYLLKNESPAFILKTILDVKNGGAQMSPSIARKAIRFLAPESPKKIGSYKSGPEQISEALSIRELEILHLVADGLTYPQIADRLFVATNTIKKHMMNIFGKLNVKNKIEALRKTEGLL
jgi:DNA-binding NarL/FixJ family response regulator